MTTQEIHAAAKTTYSEALPYLGPVSSDENPAAHGGVRYLETRQDGAERAVLVNGRHVEEGPWGPSREARRRELLAAAPPKPAPLVLDCGLIVTVDPRDGFVELSRPVAEGTLSLPADWLAAAQAYRLARVALAEVAR